MNDIWIIPIVASSACLGFVLRMIWEAQVELNKIKRECGLK